MTANSMDEKIFKLVLLIAYFSSSLAVGADDRAGILLVRFSLFYSILGRLKQRASGRTLGCTDPIQCPPG